MKKISTVAILAPGAMGSGLARRLTSSGIEVLTSLEGRSEATCKRASAAGMRDASDDDIAAADVILSVVPPTQAVALARRLAVSLGKAGRKAIYADCNAVSVETVKEIEAVIRGSGAAFVDGGIIGLPPSDTRSPTLYLSGPSAGALGGLGELGLKVQVMGEQVGAASALKMSYAGISKGMTFLASAMILGAARAGATEGLRKALQASRPHLLERLEGAIPDMFPKAHRWAPEMEQVAEFLGDGQPGQALFLELAKIGASLAEDFNGDKVLVRALEDFVKPR